MPFSDVGTHTHCVKSARTLLVVEQRALLMENQLITQSYFNFLFIV